MLGGGGARGQGSVLPRRKGGNGDGEDSEASNDELVRGAGGRGRVRLYLVFVFWCFSCVSFLLCRRCDTLMFLLPCFPLRVFHHDLGLLRRLESGAMPWR